MDLLSHGAPLRRIAFGDALCTKTRSRTNERSRVSDLRACFNAIAFTDGYYADRGVTKGRSSGRTKFAINDVPTEKYRLIGASSSSSSKLLANVSKRGTDRRTPVPVPTCRGTRPMVSAPRRYKKVLRDPVHGYIQIPHAIMPVVQSLPVQRLRNISQNARTIAAYPSQNGSRFEHALGTMHLASLAWEHAFANTFETDRNNTVKTAFLNEVAAFLEESFLDPNVRDPLLDRYFSESSDNAVQDRERRLLLEELPRMISQAVGIVGLLHDVGHAPYSHLLESLFKKYADSIFGPGTAASFQTYGDQVDGVPQFHEYAGKSILSALRAKPVFDYVSIALIAEIFGARSGTGWAACLHSIVDGQMDVDRLDYIRRDALRAGTEYYAIDQERLIESTELHRRYDGAWIIGISSRGVSAVETLLLQRAQSYRWVIHNSRAIVSDACLQRAFSIALEAAIINQDSRFRDRPNLDYVSQWQSEHPLVPASYEVDDAVVMNWLRACRRQVEAVRDPLSSRFLAYMAIADQSSDHFQPAWRTFGEFYIEIGAAANADADIASFLSLAGETPPDGTETEMADAAADSADFSTGTLKFNNAVQRLSKTSADIELTLNDRVPRVDEKPGVWVVSFIEGIKAYNREKTKLWIDNVEYYLDELSPIPKALSAAEDIRPAIWAFFIPFGPVLPKRRAVATAFILTVVELYNTMDESN